MKNRKKYERVKKTYRPWGFWEEQELIRLKLAGETYKYIAEKLDRPLPSVEGRLKRLRRELSLPQTPKWSAAEKAELKRLYLEGLSADEIADRLGRTKGAVYSMAYRLRKEVEDDV